MTYAEALTFLFTLPRFGHLGPDAYKPGLERMERLMEAFGEPHRAFPSIHIAGTNGKGSTAAMMAAMGTASGLKVGLHMSPHILDFGERMRINGEKGDHEWIAKSVSEHEALIRDVEVSFFEASVALSFLYFADKKIDAAVVESGDGRPPGRDKHLNARCVRRDPHRDGPHGSARRHIGGNRARESGDLQTRCSDDFCETIKGSP